MNKELTPGHAVCCFCMKSYLASDGGTCYACGDICCENCISDLQECPDCVNDDGYMFGISFEMTKSEEVPE